MLSASIHKKSLVADSLKFNSLSSAEKPDGFNRPKDWPDIRPTCPSGGIAFLASHSADFSTFDTLGFTASCTGGYDVYIDGVKYGDTVSSGAQTDIKWSTAGITTGYDITTPNSLRAHIIWLVPAISSNSINILRFKRSTTTSTETQGLLWLHFNANTMMSLPYLLSEGDGTSVLMPLCRAITCKGNILRISNILSAFYNAPALEYLPIIDGENNSSSFYVTFSKTNLKKLVLRNISSILMGSGFALSTNIEKIIFQNVETVASSNFFKCFQNVYSLKKLPDIDYSTAQNMSVFLTNASSLEDTILDLSSATGLKIIAAYGNASYPMYGLKKVLISSSAPFDYSVSPQINLAYTGLDRDAILTLFNSLPTVTNNQVISVANATGASSLTSEDIAIATAKGWEVLS